MILLSRYNGIDVLSAPIFKYELESYADRIIVVTEREYQQSEELFKKTKYNKFEISSDEIIFYSVLNAITAHETIREFLDTTQMQIVAPKIYAMPKEYFLIQLLAGTFHALNDLLLGTQVAFSHKILRDVGVYLSAKTFFISDEDFPTKSKYNLLANI